MFPNKLQTYALLSYAFQWHMADVEMTPINQWLIEDSLVRQNDKRPAKATMYLPNPWVLNMRGDKEFEDVFVMVRVPREVLVEHIEQTIEEASVSRQKDATQEPHQSDSTQPTTLPSDRAEVSSLTNTEQEA